MQLLKTVEVLIRLQQLGWTMVVAPTESLVLSDPKSLQPPIVLPKTAAIPGELLRHVLSGISELDVDAFVEGLTPVTLEETDDAHNEKSNEIKARSELRSSPVVKAVLSRPVGDTVDLAELTQDQINALSEDAKGVWSDHTEINDSVEWTRELREGLWRSISEDK